MAGEFEVTKLYATIVPKLSRNFETDLRSQIRRVENRIKPEITFKAKLDGSFKVIETKLKNATRDRNVKINVDIQNAEAVAKLALLARDRKTKVKVDVDRKGVDLFTSALSTAFTSLENIGHAMGRLNDIAGVVGVTLSTVSKVLGAFAKMASSAGTTAFSLGEALIGLASQTAALGVIAIIAALILALVAALAAGALAAVGFAIAAVAVGAVVTIVAAAVGAMAAAFIGAVGAIGALGAAFAVAGVALYPIIQAFQEFVNVQDAAESSSKSSATSARTQAAALRAASSSIRAAQRGILDANHNVELSLRAVTRAQRDLRNAGEDLIDAYTNQTRARQALNDAEAEAKRNLEDLARLQRDAADRQEDADLRLIRAQERLNSLNPVDNDLTDYREALLDVTKAEKDVADTREDNKRTQEDYDAAVKKGIAQSDRVVAARDALADANGRVRDSQEGLKDAELRLKDAQYDAKRATDEQTEAKLRLRDAEISYQDTLLKQGESADDATAAQAKLAKKLLELTPAGRDFFEALKGIYFWIQKLSKIGQNTFLPGVTTAIKDMKGLAPIFEKSFFKIGQTLGDIAEAFGKFFSSKEAKLAFKQIGDAANEALKVFGKSGLDITKNLLPIIGEFMEVSKPVVKAFAEALTIVGKSMGVVLKSLSTPSNIKNFVVIVKGFGQLIANIAEALGSFLELLGGSLSQSMPELVDGITRFVKGTLSALATLASSGLMKSFGKFIGSFGDALKALADSGVLEQLGRSMGFVLEALGNGFLELAKDPEFQNSLMMFAKQMPAIIDAIVKMLPSLLVALLDFLTVAAKFTEQVGPAGIFGLIATIDLALGFLFIMVITLMEVQDAISDFMLFVQLSFKFWKKIWDDITDAVTVSGTAIKTVLGLLTFNFIDFKDDGLDIFGLFKLGLGNIWDTMIADAFSFWHNLVAAVLNPMKTWFTTAFPNMIAQAVNSFGQIWGQIASLFASPVRYMINTVMNTGLIGSFNYLVGKLPGLTKITARPPGFAKGGIYPGYTPGRDIGYIGVSGGEAIMRPEFTRAVGSDFINSANSAAITGGVSGVQSFMDGKGDGYGKKYLGGFKSGGVVGFIEDAIETASNPFTAMNKGVKALISTIPTKGNIGGSVAAGGANKSNDEITKWLSDKFGSDAIVGAFTGTLGAGNAMGWQAMSAVLNKAFGTHFGAREADAGRTNKTLTGNTSYHSRGRALDLPPMRKYAEWILQNFGKNVTELITPWRELNYWHGKPHKYRADIERQHGVGAAGNDHVHWAMKNGGLVSGLGGEQSDRIKRYLSDGEFVVNAQSTKKIGVDNLRAWNDWGSSGSSSVPKGTLRPIAGDSLNGGTPQYVDHSRTVEMTVYTKDDSQVDALYQRANNLM